MSIISMNLSTQEPIKKENGKWEFSESLHTFYVIWFVYRLHTMLNVYMNLIIGD